MGGVGVAVLGQQNLVGQHRLQHRLSGARLHAKPLSRTGAGQSCHRTHRSRRDLSGGGKLRPGVQAQLVHFFCPILPCIGAAGELGFDLQGAAGDLQIGQPVSLAVPGDFVHPGAEFGGVGGLQGVLLDASEKFLHALQLQGGAEPAGEHLPGGDGGGDGLRLQRAGVQILLHQPLVAHGQLVHQGVGVCAGKGHAVLIQPVFQVRQHLLPVRSRQVHFVDKQKNGNFIPLQQPPQGLGVALHPVGAADDQNGAVQHLQGALHFCGEVHVARGVQQRQLHAVQGQDGLLGENGDAPLPLQGEGVQKGVPMVHPAQLLDAAAEVQHGLGQGGFARVHVGHDADGAFFHESLFLSPAQLWG